MPGPSSINVNCPRCLTMAGEDCVTPRGRLARHHHSSRWQELKSLRSGAIMVVEVLKDDEPLGVKAGEQYFAKTYWLDPGAKASLLARLDDGFDPSCNQYWHTIRFVRWATYDESERLAA